MFYSGRPSRWRWIGRTLRKSVDSITLQALTWSPEVKVKGDDREIRGAAILKQTSKKRDKAGDNWKDWLRTGMPDGIMSVAYIPGGATID